MKKITAILLCALLALSAVAVLAACNNNETTEVIVTFRDYTSKIMFQGKTIDGYAIEGKKPAREGYEFDGWYKTLTTDEDGLLVYTDKFDFSKVLTEDTEVYAKWNKLPTGGESDGYCLIGKVNGVTNWTPSDIPVSWRMTQEADLVTYTFTTDLASGDEFKVKTFYPDWDTKEINYGGDKVSEVTLAEGVELPEGTETAMELFTLTGNIETAIAMNVTISLHYDGKDNSTITILVNSIAAVEPA